MRSQKAGRSSGDRLVVMLPSVTTSSSTTSAPALRRSVRTLGHEVSRRPARDVGLDEVPRAVADRGDRLAGLRRSPGRTAPRRVPSAACPGSPSRPAGAARRSRRPTPSPTSRSTAKVPASSRSWSRAWISPLGDGDDVGAGAGVVQRLPRLLQLDPLHPVGREDGDPSSVQCRRHVSRSCHRRVQDDLGPAVVAVVEVLVGLRRLVEGQLVADDERRLGLARGDQVAQLPVVLLDRRLAAADVLALEPEHAVVEGELALLRQLVAGPGVLRARRRRRCRSCR